VFKPSTDSENLLVYFENKIFSFWVWSALWVTSQWWHVSAILRVRLPGPGRQPKSHFWLNVFWKLGYHLNVWSHWLAF